MKITTTIAKNKEAVLLQERLSMTIDRIRDAGTLDVSVPAIPLITLSRVVVAGDGDFDIVNDYTVDN